MRGAGYTTHEEPFSFSRFPAQAGPSLLALLLGISGIIAARVGFFFNSPGIALIIAFGGALASNFLGRWLLAKGITRLRWMRTQSVNLVATRSQNTHVWLVAHLDSKSQTIPMLVRIMAVMGSSVFFVLMMLSLAAAFAASRGWIPAGYAGISSSAVIASMLLALWLVPIVFCFIGNKSRGALDNASGVAAVLIAAERANAGVLITSGEELGLAGARAFVSARDEKGIALNCDTIDDNGRFIAMTYGPAKRAANAISVAAQTRGLKLKKRRMIPGILADNVAFSGAGWDSCTLAKGNLTTLAFVHTSGDRNTSIRGTGIAQAAEILVAAVEELS